jgi:OmpA-OmpF porin, OOP family
MRSTMQKFVMALLVLYSTGVAAPADAQIADRLKQRAKDKIEQKTGEKVERAIDQAVDGAEKPAADEPEAAKPGAAPAAADARPGEGAWANYDFVPGERILFAEDFSRDRVGNFPQRMEFIAGNLEIVESKGRRWLRATEGSRITVPLPETLGERFTIEYDITIPANWETLLYFSAEGVDNFERGSLGACCYVPTGGVFVNSTAVGVRRNADVVASSRDIHGFLGYEGAGPGTPIRVRVHVDGSYVKVYVNETRVANAPNVQLPRGNKLYFDFNAQTDLPILFGNLSVNAGGQRMYDALVADGRFTTQGIFFDTGSDRMRPESTPTLKEIGEMLKQHPELRVCIEGHTDNLGQVASNQALSEKRAAAVRQYLVQSFGIAPTRLEAMGFGQSKPAAANDTPEGRQQNRRVELVRL